MVSGNIYLLRCPISFEIKYIGVTCGCINQRLKEHISLAKHGRMSNKALSFWIINLIKNGFAPTVELIECDAKDRYSRENYWIVDYILKGHKLFNIRVSKFEMNCRIRKTQK